MKKAFLLLVLMFISLPTWAGQEVITLMHRNAEDILMVKEIK